MVSTVLTGSAVLSAFAEGVAAAITIYGICKETAAVKAGLAERIREGASHDGIRCFYK